MGKSMLLMFENTPVMSINLDEYTYDTLCEELLPFTIKGKLRKVLTYEEVKEYIENCGYKLLSKEYINNHTKLKLKCPKGHIFELRFNDFKNGQRCRQCFNEWLGDKIG